jgi:hypothetical protein
MPMQAGRMRLLERVYKLLDERWMYLEEGLEQGGAGAVPVDKEPQLSNTHGTHQTPMIYPPVGCGL